MEIVCLYAFAFSPSPFLQCQDVYSISMLEEEKVNPKCISQPSLLSFVELPDSPKKQQCLDPQMNCQNFIGFKMDNADAYSPCVVGIDVEMENLEKTKSNNEAVGSLKGEGLLTVSPSSLLCNYGLKRSSCARHQKHFLAIVCLIEVLLSAFSVSIFNGPSFVWVIAETIKLKNV